MKGLSTAQVEKLMQIADYLRKERERKSILLEEIAVKTFIPLRLLQALDDGQIERLPEPVFVQGFIRRYADSLGLEGMALAKTFPIEPSPTEVATPEPDDRNEHRNTAPPVIASPVKEAAKERGATSTTNPPHPRDTRPARSPARTPYVVFGSVALLLLAAGAFGIANRSPQGTRPQGTQEGAIAASPSLPLESPSPSPFSPPTSEIQATTPASPETSQPSEPLLNDSLIQVEVDLKDGDSWIEVVVDGKTEFEGTLRQGMQRTWTAQNKLVLISGNAGAVYVTYNRGKQTKLGPLGQVREMVFPPKDNTLSQTNTQTNE